MEHNGQVLLTQCLKITEKVSINFASEASYVYILSGQKFIENAKNSQFCKTQAYIQTVLSDRSILIRRKNSVKNAKIGKFKCDFFGDLQTL